MYQVEGGYLGGDKDVLGDLSVELMQYMCDDLKGFVSTMFCDRDGGITGGNIKALALGVRSAVIDDSLCYADVRQASMNEAWKISAEGEPTTKTSQDECICAMLDAMKTRLLRVYGMPSNSMAFDEWVSLRIAIDFGWMSVPYERESRHVET